MTPTKIIFSAVVIAYPVIVYFGLEYFEVRIIAVVLIFVALARLVLMRRLKFLKTVMPQTYLIAIALLLVGVSAVASNSPILLQYYPVCLSGFMLALFLFSLLRPPTIIEQIARLGDRNFTESAIPYTRKVTVLWCGFFTFNGAVALYTILVANMEFWAIYNGFISYMLMGLLFAGEYIVRRRVLRDEARTQCLS